MSIEISRVETKKDLTQFIKLPWKIYKNDPHWVPPLIIDMKKILNKQKNPFFQHSEAEYFLARQNGQVAGRIAAIINHNHNNFHNENIGFFGFFECVNEPAISEALFQTAVDWVKEKGMSQIRGPMNFSTNDTCGMLYEGFDSPPVIMMTYNPEYYLSLLKQAGFLKIKELYAYYFDSTMPMPSRFESIGKRTLRDKSIQIRKINLKDFENEVKTVLEIYNEAWKNNWGFVPMTEAEFQHLAKDLKPAVDRDIVYIAEVNGEPAGFSLALPDYNQILKDINGRLFPFGIVKLLMNKNKISRVRVITLGVKQKFLNKRGLAPTFYYETYRQGINKGYTLAEFSWILDENVLMNRSLEAMGAKLYKKYAIYEKKISR
ncbi:MAG: GNAT family N-acetyltransferase [bacterium]